MGPDKTRGNTVPEQGQTTTQEPVPRAPHERDESADSQGSREPSGKDIGGQAHDDLSRGLKDTRKQPEMDRAYDKLKKS